MLIDGDIHLGYRTLSDLLRYLDEPTRELVASSGTNGLAMPSYPWHHPAGWIRQDVYERGSASGDFPYLSLDLVRARHLDAYGVSRDRRTGRGRGLCDPPERAARGAALQRLQRLAARARATGRAAPARDDRRAGAVAGGCRARDPARGRTRGVCRDLPPRGCAHPVREPRVRPGGREPRPAASTVLPVHLQCLGAVEQILNGERSDTHAGGFVPASLRGGRSVGSRVGAAMRR